MVNRLLRLIAPHYCYGCGEVGVSLCSNCKYDITSDGLDGCIVCAQPTLTGICRTCHTSFDKAWCIAERRGAIRRLIDAYKFERVIDASDVLAELLDTYLPVLPRSTVIVPVPSASAHIRQRGYDHVDRVASRLARRRGLQLGRVIERVGSEIQRGSTKSKRHEQAERSYRCRQRLDPDRQYLIVDDVVTTGATVSACASALKRAGAQHVWVATIARQPLDK